MMNPLMHVLLNRQMGLRSPKTGEPKLPVMSKFIDMHTPREKPISMGVRNPRTEFSSEKGFK